MARKPRLHVEGGVYHVMLRGNGGRDIFFTSDDRRFFYGLIEEGIERFDYRVHGFCLMTNHVHLVVQIGTVPLGRPMQNLAFRYSRRINRRERRLGHLFQGRYKALLVEAESHLLELVRYVHLNPVRAGLVAAPEDYPWSGHHAYLGDERLAWLSTDWVLAQFGKRQATARSRYRAFVAEGLGARRNEAFHQGGDDSRVLGAADFSARALGAAAVAGDGRPKVGPDLTRLIERVAALRVLDSEALAGPSRRRDLAEARGMVGYLARASGAGTLTGVARRFGRDPGTLSRAVRRVEERAAREPGFAAALKAQLE